MGVTLKSNLGKIADQAEQRAELVVAKTASDIEADAKARSRVDTGQMRAGWQEIQLGPFAREVRNSVEHVVHNEYGTEDMPAQPMLGPAVESARGPFERAMGQVFGG